MSLAVNRAYIFIKEHILDGSYRPSQKLVEYELALTIGVSRNTVKKALLKLEQENLVILEANKGAKIKDFTLDEIINYLEIREVLEGAIIRRTASIISEDDLDEMSCLIEEMTIYASKNQLEEYSLCNKAFHEIIYSTSKNQEAVALVKQIKTQLQRLQLKTNLVPGRIQNSMTEHKNILEALKAHDQVTAQDAIIHHISQLKRTIKKNYHQLV